jgi:sirohydrochlorin ferrochelatase
MADNALIIVAHGSRKERSNEEVKALTQKVQTFAEYRYTFVKTAFLEFATPSLEESILECINDGSSNIVILPYFLAYGNHVSQDIPNIVNTMRQQHPDVVFTLKEHLGSASGMPSLLSSMV